MQHHVGPRGCGWVILIGVVVSVLLVTTLGLLAHDKRHSKVTPQQKSWFDSLRSGKGPCCSDADGTALSDVEWESKDGRYRVLIDGKWLDVPDEAVLKQPNLYGPTMVWLMYNSAFGGQLNTQIRCFIPGMMT